MTKQEIRKEFKKIVTKDIKLRDVEITNSGIYFFGKKLDCLALWHYFGAKYQNHDIDFIETGFSTSDESYYFNVDFNYQ